VEHAAVARDTGQAAIVRAVAWLAIVGWIASAPARADVESEERTAGSSGDPEAVVARVTRGPEGFEVESRTRVAVPLLVAWQVLSDYDGIGRFVSSIRESRVVARGRDSLVVEQVAVGRLFLFSRRMRARLAVVEESPKRIRFEDLSHRDFDVYRGEWRLEPAGDTTEIVYRVIAKPSFSIPDFVARGMFQRTVRDLVAEVAAEMRRRAAATENSRQAGSARAAPRR
jgi:hypothetical protein